MGRGQKQKKNLEHEGEKSGESDGARFVVVDTCLSAQDAQMARVRLEGMGIPVFLDNENMVAVNPLYGPVTGGVKLLVPEDRAGEAAEILSASNTPSCPECHSSNVRKEPMSALLFIASILLLSLPAWLIARPWRCADCGHQWK